MVTVKMLLQGTPKLELLNPDRYSIKSGNCLTAGKRRENDYEE